MDIRIPVKKRTFITKTKTEFMGRMHGTTKDSSGTFRSCYIWDQPELVYGVNSEKYRPKRAVDTEAKRKRDSQNNLRHPRKIVREGHWKFTVYVFPVDLLKMAGVKVKQNARNFELVPVKK